MNPHPTIKRLKKTSRIVVVLLFYCLSSQLFAQSHDSQLAVKDTICPCKPSLPIEIAVTSILWGYPNYVIWRSTLLRDTTAVNANAVLIGPSLFLLMFTLGPISELTSDYEGSWWHTLWIGLYTGGMSALLFNAFTKKPPEYHSYKFNIPDYLALGLAPSLASVFIYNLFLHPRENSNHSMYLLPSFGIKNTASLNFMMQF